MTRPDPEPPSSSGGVSVRGFRFGATPAGIRKDGRADLALAVADADATVAAVFTRNLVRAAPVEVAIRRVASGSARAVIVNSGCANACTGKPGLQATLQSCEAVARELGLDAETVLPASTGVIGALLPADRIEAAVPRLVQSLSPGGFADFAAAIMTTDRWPKLAHVRVRDGAVVVGIAKGAGMIHPELAVAEPPHATMLAFLFTDALVEQRELQAALNDAVDTTFNRISVDGDTSTNDCVVVLASGRSGQRLAAEELRSALAAVCDELGRSMLADGEGSSHVAEIRVSGLSSDADALRVARTVATSLLVKTALHGCDANWGRLLAAAGRAGVPFDPSIAAISVGGIPLVERGVSLGSASEERVNAVLATRSYVIEMVLGSGPGRSWYLTSDLGHEYVDVNAGYRS